MTDKTNTPTGLAAELAALAATAQVDAPTGRGGGGGDVLGRNVAALAAGTSAWDVMTRNGSAGSGRTRAGIASLDRAQVIHVVTCHLGRPDGSLTTAAFAIGYQAAQGKRPTGGRLALVAAGYAPSGDDTGRTMALCASDPHGVDGYADADAIVADVRRAAAGAIRLYDAVAVSPTIG